MRRATILLAAFTALLLPTCVLGQICGGAITLRSEQGTYLTWGEIDTNFLQVRNMCNSDVEDGTTSCADGEGIAASSGTWVCSAVPAGTTVATVTTTDATVTTIATIPIADDSTALIVFDVSVRRTDAPGVAAYRRQVVFYRFLGRPRL